MTNESPATVYLLVGRRKDGRPVWLHRAGSGSGWSTSRHLASRLGLDEALRLSALHRRLADRHAPWASGTIRIVGASA
jgi:hypothetical protein